MQYKLRPLIRLSIAAAISFLTIECVSAQSLFDVDFEAPLHEIGSEPATGTLGGPTSVVFGSPTVVEDSLLPSQSLEFQLPSSPPSNLNGLEQIRFQLGNEASIYRVAFDLTFDSLVPAEFTGESFTLLFDTPRIQNLNFQRFPGADEITISVFQPTPNGPSISRNIGTAANGELLQFEIEVDIEAQRWIINEGGTTLLNGDFFVSGDDLESVRFSLSDRNSNGDSRVLLDNVQFSAIPEPSSLGVLLSICVLGPAYRRRRSA